MPFVIDWLLVPLCTYGVVGLVLFRREIAFRGRWERPIHWLIVGHLAITVVMHLGILATASHRVLAVFPYGYSYLAVLYFGFFAWRSWTIRFRCAPS